MPNKRNIRSLIALLFCWAFIYLVGNVYFPKWDKKVGATISWDVTGYYWYLPAIFIYKDVKQQQFGEAIIAKYRPTSWFSQSYVHPSGNRVMKYSCGQAVQYLPFFWVAHLYALNSDKYPADGFSVPYQLAISIGSWLMAFLGLFFLRKILLRYFSDSYVAMTLVVLVLATNYLNYSAIDGAMTHNWLFTLYTLLIWSSIRFYERPNLFRAMAIGGLVGLAALTRPTEIIGLLIPLFWYVDFPIRAGLKKRFQFIKLHWSKYFAAIIIGGLVGSLQLIYWKYTTGSWLVYSYQDEGFSWLSPHLWKGLFSYKSGWLKFTPVMVFALAGFWVLWREKRNFFLPTFLFSILFIYIAFAWDIWWYGGSLGQRTMVQAYPVLAIPLTAFFQFIFRKGKSYGVTMGLLFVFFAYYNLWMTHQAHRGGTFYTDQMTRAYFWKIFGRFDIPEDACKLMDTDEEYTGERRNVKVLLTNDFETAKDTFFCDIPPISGNHSMCLNKERQNSPFYGVAYTNGQSDWVRASATLLCKYKEWDVWRMAQMKVRFLNNEKVVKERGIRVYRLLKSGEQRRLYIDVSCPRKDFNRVEMFFWNGDGTKPLLVDDMVLEGFN